MKKHIAKILLLLSLLFFFTTQSYSANNYLRRFALLVGANNGGSDRVLLRYAESDASTVGHVMRKLGGIKHHDIRTLKQPSVSKLLREFWYFKYKIMVAKRRHKRVEAIFYYSGHSNEHGLLLAGKLLSYKKIKQLVKDIPADIKIAILDSCASGSLIRLKGGKMRAPFLLDTSMKMKGTVFLTSSSHNEASQESDKIRGSFFTHYLISGLRGGADMTKDGRITLNEAYQFAYHQTLARTEKTLTGPQHPGYSVQMSGSGDVVLTDIRRSSTQLTFHSSISGRISIRTVGNVFIAELNKAAGKHTRLGLEPGKYVITLQKGKKVKQSIITLYRGSRKILAPYSFRQVAVLADTRGKGKKKKYRDSAFGIINTAKIDARGFFFGFIGNYTKKSMSGLQLALIYNVNNLDFSGLQYGLIFCYNGRNFSGIQSSFVYCYNVGNFSGFQESFVYNYNGGNFVGMQAGLGYNLNKGSFSGMQATLVLNRNDGPLEGMQGSLLLNIAGSINGIQAGMINISGKVKGVQLGLINFADEADVPIGILNFVKNGQFALNFWYDELDMFNFGLKMGGKYTYSIISAGSNVDRDFLNLGISLGCRFKISNKIFLNIDTGSRFFIAKNSDGWAFEEKNGDPTILSTTRCWVQIEMLGSISLIGGVSFNMLYEDNPKVRPNHNKLLIDSGVKAWSGFFIGIQIL